MYRFTLRRRTTSLSQKATAISVPNIAVPQSVSGRILAINAPADGAVRTRKVVTRSRSRATGKYPSWKMQRMMQWESTHELNVYRLLDVDPEVLSYHEQPVEVVYLMDGEERLHYPDTLVRTRGGSELWEVKTSYYARRPDILARTALLTTLLPSYGYQYRMILAEELGRDARIRNACTLLQYGRPAIGSNEREHLRLLLERTSDLSWGDVLAGALGTNSRAYACRLLLEGVLSCDMTIPLASSTRLTYMVRSTAIPVEA